MHVGVCVKVCAPCEPGHFATMERATTYAGHSVIVQQTLTDLLGEPDNTAPTVTKHCQVSKADAAGYHSMHAHAEGHDKDLKSATCQKIDSLPKTTATPSLLSGPEVSLPNNLSRGHLHCKGHKVALHTGRDVERAGCGVHAGAVLAVGDLLQHNLDLVEPAPVVHTLPDQLDG